MSDKVVRVYDHQVYKENPFKEGLVQKIGNVKKNKIDKWMTKSGSFVDNVTGEIKDGQDLLVGIKKKVDSEQFTKVYHDELKKTVGLSDRAVKLLMFIAGSLQKDHLEVELDSEVVCEVTGMGSSTYYRALNELLNHQVIARTKYSYKYFINPVHIFNGNRLTIVTQYVKDTAAFRNSKGKLMSELPPAESDQDVSEWEDPLE